MRYLFNEQSGPDKANEHTDCRAVAAEDGVEIGDENVWHVALSTKGGPDRDLTDDEWADVARTVVSRVGFAGPGVADPCAWVAVRHGKSADGNDHLHEAVNLIRQGGQAASIHRLHPKPGAVCSEREARYGLTVVEGRTLRAAMPGLTRSEIHKAARAGKGAPERVEVARAARAAAVGLRTDSEFVRRLRAAGVAVKPRDDRSGAHRVVGYSVAQQPAEGEVAVSFAGGSLAKVGETKAGRVAAPRGLRSDRRPPTRTSPEVGGRRGAVGFVAVVADHRGPMADTTTVPIDLLSPSAFASGHPVEQYRWLRAHDPVHHHPEAGGTGFWAVMGYDDVHAVSRDARTYSSWAGGVMLADGDPAQLDAARRMMLYMDAPDHTRHRRLVTPGFTPKAAARWRSRIDALAVRIVDAVADQGGCDLVEDVAGEMPSLVVAELMGIPADDARRLYRLTEVMHSADPALSDDDRLGAMLEMLTYGAEVAAAKRAAPADDLTTILVSSEIDGEVLSDEDLMWFFLLLVNAGGDTTRNLFAGAVEALLAAPESWRALRADPSALMAGAVEELLRFVSPVVHMRRTATTDTVLHGQPIDAGDKVVVFYGSANRDESVFGADAERLDIRRSPNPHVAFGGGGPHFCLGAHIARLEVVALLREVVTRMPDLRLDGPISRLQSNFIVGAKHMPVAWTPA